MSSDSSKPSLRTQFGANISHLDSKLDHAPWGLPHVRYGAELPKLVEPEQFAKDLVISVRRQTEGDISPFYEMLLAGSLSREQLQKWVIQLYFDVRCFPPLIAQIVANSHYQYDVRQTYGLNLGEELGEFHPKAEHPMLLLQLCRALGLKDEEVEFAQPIPELLLYVEYRHKLVRDGSFLEGVAAGSLAIESTIIQRYKRIITAMKKHYGVPDEALDFFYIHAGGRGENDYGGDWAHAKEAMDLVTKYATTPETQERCRQAVFRSVEARKVYQWGLFRHIVLSQNEFYKELIKPKSTDSKAS